jgi:hypothetical protein
MCSSRQQWPVNHHVANGLFFSVHSACAWIMPRIIANIYWPFCQINRQQVCNRTCARVSNKSVYNFINVRSSVISCPIELNPIPVNFPGHFASISIYIYTSKTNILQTLCGWNLELPKYLRPKPAIWLWTWTHRQKGFWFSHLCSDWAKNQFHCNSQVILHLQTWNKPVWH